MHSDRRSYIILASDECVGFFTFINMTSNHLRNVILLFDAVADEVNNNIY